MIRSMTGFGSSETEILPLGRISAELRSTNHKFLEVVLHLPEGFLSLEDKIKKEIENKIKRGRITCALNLSGAKPVSVSVNKELLRKYLSAIRDIKREFSAGDGPDMNTLLHLPGVLSLAETRISKPRIWPRLRVLINQALGQLLLSRQKEGSALCGYLKSRVGILGKDTQLIKVRFKNAVKDKIARIENKEERLSFLKDTDITEEMERLTFHIRNFKNKLLKKGPMGKELDFIAQEMQREANTLAAKCSDAQISARVVQIKSHIEKIREQVQNIE